MFSQKTGKHFAFFVVLGGGLGLFWGNFLLFWAFFLLYYAILRYFTLYSAILHYFTLIFDSMISYLTQGAFFVIVLGSSWDPPSQA